MSSSNSFSVFAIADLHLSFGLKNKKMDVFGDQWKNWTEKIASHWKRLVSPEDLVLIPGDISWAMKPSDALADLRWIDQLPGTKVMIRGNHDYWWASKTKVEKILPPSLHIIQNNAFHFHDLSIAGARLWDTPEYNFNEFIVLREAPVKVHKKPEDAAKIFSRELSRLEFSLKELDQKAKIRIAMTHYPPIGEALAQSGAAKLLEKYNVDIAVFGHLHNVKPKSLPFGKKRGVLYALTSCDYLDFKPLKIF